MRILVIENDKEPYEMEINKDIQSMHEIVDGLIEPIYFDPTNKAIAWCNEEFLMNGSEPNRMVGECLVHGTFFLSGNCRNEHGEWDSCSLTDEQIRQYSEEFAEPIQNVSQELQQDPMAFFMM